MTYPINQIIAGFWSLALWHLPAFDYWGHAYGQVLRSDVMPNWPGV